MALTFFVINMHNSALSTHMDRQAALDEQFVTATQKRMDELNALLNAGWVVIASYTDGLFSGGLLLKFILFKPDANQEMENDPHDAT